MGAVEHQRRAGLTLGVIPGVHGEYCINLVKKFSNPIPDGTNDLRGD
jgi:hypothetical protein